MALIHERMVAILRDTKAIGKDMTNQAQGFKFRGIDQVYNALNDIFQTHGVFICPEVTDHQYVEKTTKSGSLSMHHFLRVKYHFTAEDGSAVMMETIGEAADTGDKGLNKCMSIALKYALFECFLIPTQEDKDPDAHTTEFSRRAKKGEYPLDAEQKRILEEKKATLTGAQQPMPPPPAPAPAPAKGKSQMFEVLTAFNDIKAKMGDQEYYKILGNNGYEKSNEITVKETARAIYKQMAERLKEIELEKENALP